MKIKYNIRKRIIAKDKMEDIPIGSVLMLPEKESDLSSQYTVLDKKGYNFSLLRGHDGAVVKSYDIRNIGPNWYYYEN